MHWLYKYLPLLSQIALLLSVTLKFFSLSCILLCPHPSAQNSLSFLQPKVSSLPFSFILVSSFKFLPSILEIKMSYAHLLNTEASLVTFRQTFNIPKDVNMAYCHESKIALHKGANTAFFPLMAILEGGIRFLVNPLLLNTLRFYGLCPDQLPPNFYRVVNCVSRLNQIYGLQLNHHDINFMYSLCGNKRTNYYLKVRDMRVRLISCLLDSNRNSAGEFIRVRSKLVWRLNPFPALAAWSWFVPITNLLFFLLMIVLLIWMLTHCIPLLQTINYLSRIL